MCIIVSVLLYLLFCVYVIVSVLLYLLFWVYVIVYALLYQSCNQLVSLSLPSS